MGLTRKTIVRVLAAFIFMSHGEFEMYWLLLPRRWKYRRSTWGPLDEFVGSLDEFVRLTIAPAVADVIFKDSPIMVRLMKKNGTYSPPIKTVMVGRRKVKVTSSVLAGAWEGRQVNMKRRSLK